MFDISCPECGTKYSVPLQAAGKKTQCKKCENSFTIPISGSTGIQPIAPREATVIHEVRAKGTFASAFGVSTGIVFGGAAAILVLFVCCSGVVVWIAGNRTEADGERIVSSKSPTSEKPQDGSSETSEESTKPQTLRQTIDGATVEIVRAVVGEVPYSEFGQERSSSKPLMAIGCRISTDNPTKKYDYRSWQDTIQFHGSLKDNFDNKYKWIDFGFAASVPLHVRSASVRESEPAFDLLIFEPPLQSAKYLDLDLDGDRVGVNGKFRFRMYSEYWNRK